jgi:protein arginine kinase activator
MKCDLCGANNAKYKYYEVNSDTVREINLCKKCAREKGVDIKSKEDSKVVETGVCPVCGLTFREYKESRSLGCAECYKTFKDQIKAFLKESQLGILHKGKKPVRNSEVIVVKKEILEMKKKLDNYVEDEKFEEAVKLRDKIEARKEELKTIREKND